MINAEVQLESNNWNKIINNPNKLILETIKKFPKDYKFLNKRIYITVLLTNNKKIQLLNKNFRKKNKPTDILSFPFFDKKSLKKK